MKKISFILVYYTSILLSAFIMAACSSDNEDNNENDSTIDSSKHISRIIEILGTNYSKDRKYTYDTQGRVVLVNEVEHYMGKDDQGEITYHYDKNSIQCHSENGYYIDDHIYTLANGLIVEEFYKRVSNDIIVHTIEYKYDNDRHITSIVDNVDVEGAPTLKWDIVWKDEDIVSFGKYIYKTSEIPWNENMIFELNVNYLDPNLLLTGYFGKTPKHMPLTYGYDNFDYTLGPDGLISKIKRNNEELSITWE